MDVTSSNTCDGCYVNPAEIRQQPWDPRVCIEDCRAQFLRTAYPGWTETEGWREGCGSLDRGTALSEFWQLYWCDSVFCGVANSQGGLGQDPNVNFVINTCQNNGFFNIFDPGPPPAEFACTTETKPTSCSPTGTPSTTTPPQATESGKSQTTTESSTLAGPGVIPQPTTNPKTSPSTSGNELTGQGKAAIAICSVLALLLLLSLVVVFIRRRKQRKALAGAGLRPRRSPDGGIIIDHSIGPTSSPTPLITPVKTAGGGVRTIIAPPLRLRDHKFTLPSIFRRGGDRSPSPPLTPLTTADEQPSDSGGAVHFPTSPLYSPTTSKLTPRYERVGGVAAIPRTYTSTSAAARERERQYSQHYAPSGVGRAVATAGGPYNRGSGSASSVYSATGGEPSTGHSSMRNETSIAAPSPSLSPMRPPRPHEEVLDIPGLLGTSSSAGSSIRAASGGGGGGSTAAGRTWDFGDGIGARSSPRRTAASGSGTPTSPPPPQPPLSPPAVRALQRAPPGVAPSPSPSMTSSSSSVLRGSAWREHATGSTPVPATPTTPRAPPPSVASGRTATTGTTWRSPPSSTPPPPYYARLSERDSPVPQEVVPEKKVTFDFEERADVAGAAGSGYAWAGSSTQESGTGKKAG
ncbi:hypothetical protein VTJ49DRAFT_1097 [Mycothermus thermophilus]|uniref:Uncharacterized protein n=1 Tax=Humicola insolens TaxID=85995 RepID=A0ABR3VDP6_HUMIN